MTTVGMNADQLEAFARTLDSSAQEVHAMLVEGAGAIALATLGTTVATIWRGPRAQDFANLWSSRHLAHLRGFESLLRDGATKARREAQQQRQTSEATGASSSGRGITRLVRPEVPAALLAALRAARKGGPAEQQAWWASLSPADQQLLINGKPGELIGMLGLPADVLEKAKISHFAGIDDGVVTGSTKVRGEYGFDVKMVKGELGVDITTTKLASGRVEVTFSADQSAGIGVVQGGFGQGVTYSFDSEAEAQAFLNGLIQEAVPNNKELAGFGLLGGAGAVAADASRDIAAYLSKYSSNLKSISGSTSVKGGIEGSAGGAQVEGSLEAGLEVERDVRTNETTFKAYVKASATAMFGGAGASGEVEVSGSLTLGPDGSPKMLTVQLEGSGAVLAGAAPGLTLASAASASMALTFDLTDPEVASAAQTAADAMKRGDTVAAYQAVRGLYDRAEIVVQQQTTDSVSAGLDAGVVKAKLTTETTVTTKTSVKPSGGSFYEVKQ